MVRLKLVKRQAQVIVVDPKDAKAFAAYFQQNGLPR
jgi:hypothetical protein